MDLSLHPRFLHLPGPNVVVMADLHIGYGRQQSGVETYDERQIIDEALRAVRETEPKRVVLAGDTLHRFGENHPDTFEVLNSLIEALERSTELIALSGNHDGHRFDGEPFSGVCTRAHYRAGEAVIAHGHRPIPEGGPAIIGHLHPTLTVQGDRWPCYLKGPYQDRTIIVLPSFNPNVAGVPVSNLYHEVHDGALAARDLHGLKPIVVDPETDERRTFPTLRTMHEHGFAR